MSLEFQSSEAFVKLSGPADAILFGQAGGEVSVSGQVICLSGSLGAGKTTLVSGIAKGLGHIEAIQSPTFILVAEHLQGRLPLYHMDLYRLGESAKKEISLFDEYIFGEGVCAIEWAEWIEEWLPEDRLNIYLQKEDETPDTRSVRMFAQGKKSMEVLKLWIQKWSSWQ